MAYENRMADELSKIEPVNAERRSMDHKGPGQTGLDADSRVSIDYPPGIAERQLGSIQDMLMYGLKTGTGVADQGLWRCGRAARYRRPGAPPLAWEPATHFPPSWDCRPLEDCGWTVSSPPMNSKTEEFPDSRA
jgi:hypothetical protein